MILNIIIIGLLLSIISIYFYYNRTTIIPTTIRSYDNVDKNNTLSVPFIHSI